MKRLLIADDDAGMRAALEARFQRRGWLVDVAVNGTEALEKFRAGPAFTCHHRCAHAGPRRFRADARGANFIFAHGRHSINRLRLCARCGRSHA